MQFLKSTLHNYGIRHREQSAYEKDDSIQGQTERAKFGINVWVGAIKQNGYVHKVQIYTCKHGGAERVLEWYKI